jgi:undecaprenyl-diphosphatase
MNPMSAAAVAIPSGDAAGLVGWAQLAGPQALPIFVATLALLLAAACAVWWLGRRRVTAWPLAWRWAAGLATIGVGAGVFTTLATAVGAADADRTLALADQALTDAIRIGVPPSAVQVFGLLTHLGDTATLTALCAVVALLLILDSQRGLAFGWVLALAGNGLLNSGLKQVFGRSRPLRGDGSVLEPGFSFPSGHSSGAVVAYGMLAYLALRLLPPRWHLPAVLLALALACTVAASRLFLRVHFGSDVLAGIASGSAWLALCIVGIELPRGSSHRGKP